TAADGLERERAIEDIGVRVKRQFGSGSHGRILDWSWGRDCPLRADRGPRSSQGSKTARRRRGRRALVLDGEETAIQWEIPGNPAPTSSVFLFAAAASPSHARNREDRRDARPP